MKTPDGCCSLKTSVVEFGVSMPRMSGTVLVGFVGAPTRSPKYAETYPVATLVSKPRSIAYLTSADVTSRFTGGLKRTPLRMCTVTVLPPFETVGMRAARSGTASTLFGLYASSVRWVAYVISYENE
jgi:hypothetical protein